MSSIFLHSSQNASQKRKRIFSSQELLGASLVIWRLRLHASTAVGKGLIPGQGTKISYAMQTNKYIVKNQTNNQKRALKFLNVEDSSGELATNTNTQSPPFPLFQFSRSGLQTYTVHFKESL